MMKIPLWLVAIVVGTLIDARAKGIMLRIAIDYDRLAMLAEEHDKGEQMPGVHAVLTGEDYRTDGLGSLPSMAPYKSRSGGLMFLPPRPAIALNRVMHVGYPVAVAVADTLDQALDAVERVVVDYEPRPAVVSARDAFASRPSCVRPAGACIEFS